MADTKPDKPMSLSQAGAAFRQGKQFFRAIEVMSDSVEAALTAETRLEAAQKELTYVTGQVEAQRTALANLQTETINARATLAGVKDQTKAAQDELKGMRQAVAETRTQWDKDTADFAAQHHQILKNLAAEREKAEQELADAKAKLAAFHEGLQAAHA